MSDHFLQFIPVDPFYRPSPEAAAAARRVADDLFPDLQAWQEITVWIGEQPSFIDCGGNCVAIRCPACGAGVEAWWSDAMSAWWEGDRMDIRATTPCCATATDLNSLDYDWPQGIASWCLSVRNAGRLDVEVELKRLEAVVGSPLRIIRQRI